MNTAADTAHPASQAERLRMTEIFLSLQGEARDVGFNLRNQDLANVLRKIATEGSKGVLEGEVAQAIVD